MHGTESRFVIGPSNILFSGVYVSTFQPGNFAAWGSEGVKSYKDLLPFQLYLCSIVVPLGQDLSRI